MYKGKVKNLGCSPLPVAEPVVGSEEAHIVLGGYAGLAAGFDPEVEGGDWSAPQRQRPDFPANAFVGDVSSSQQLGRNDCRLMMTKVGD